ncbi:MAG: hypothetical protein AAF628_31310 [Planctomycetota bacterium]
MNARIRLVAVSTALLAPWCHAQGPDLELLPEDTTFVVHAEVQQVAQLLDLERILSRVRGGKSDLPRGRVRLEADVLQMIEDQWGVRPLRELRSVTLFGDKDFDEPTVMIRVSDEFDRLLDGMRDAGALRPELHAGLEFERLDGASLASALGVDDGGDHDGGGYVFVQPVNEGLAILVGERPRDLVHAARVLHGDALSVRHAHRPALEGRPGGQSIVFAELASSLEDLTRRTPASKIAGKVRRVVLDVTANGDSLGVVLAAETDSAEDARDVAAVIDGLRGLVSLAATEEHVPPFVAEALRSARADAAGTRVTVRFRFSIDELRTIVHEHADEAFR